MLKQYIEEKCGKDVLLEYEANPNNNDDKESQKEARNVKDLSDSYKTKLVNLIADYGIAVFGLNPLPHQYRILATAAVDLIPGLRSKSGSPIVG